MADRATQAPARRRRGNKVAIPDVLPEEFLTDSSDDDSEEDDDDDLATGAAAGPKRRKVAIVESKLTRLDRAPQDERVGSTVYRVAGKTENRLPPKLKKSTKNHKAGLLKRNRTTAVKSRAGFLKK